MAVLWRIAALMFIVTGCTGQVDPISFDEELNQPRQRNDPCVDTSGKRPVDGVCLPMRECPLAMEAYTTVGEPMLTTCGFEGVTRIVCCVKVEPKRVISPDGAVTVSLKAVDISSPDLDFECTNVPFIEPTGPQRHHGIGGVNAQPNKWPWTALMGWSMPDGSTWWRCGAALINRRWVVTAAHCFDKGEPQVVRLGEHNYSNADGPFRQDFKIRRYLLYPEYSINAAYHDLALVELDRPIELKRQVVPVCLPWGSESLTSLPGDEVLLTGWGALQHGGDLSPVLQVVTLSVFTPKVCDTSYRVLPGFDLDFPRGINEGDFLCAGDEAGGKDACSGDSGSPIIYYSISQLRFVLAGVVSKGYGCGLADFPGLYTPLLRGEYLDWIKRTAFS